MSRHVSDISARLSLRAPQRKSLEILHRVLNLGAIYKGADTRPMLTAVRNEFPMVEDFERSFPTLCFALATGVGKTRLMGAFISYLFLARGIRNYFVLAPNLTVYNKLIADFTANTQKYVFQGISEFAVKWPTIVTSDNFEERPQVTNMFERDDIVINIFNISKFNVRSTDARKIRRLSEYLGQSYFDHLASLNDLVLIMDEAHRYRADLSMQSIEELKPILGLELTATPQIELGTRTTRFKNVIFDYPLSQAMRDGYVKEPAVATRVNFNPSMMDPGALERLKLEDGIRVHESVKVDLDVFAQQNAVPKIKPFMLVVASDTEHADALLKLMEDSQFFDGRYRGRVIKVHSGQKGAEKDENVERLLDVERFDEPTEIVIHVNMLKEGWDVTNLYTIVPLRAADSRTLVEQSIGRGLRLPYGKRTGVAAVDRLTIIAHDRFQDIVDEAKKGGYTFSTVKIGEDISEKPKQTVVIPTILETLFGVKDFPSNNCDIDGITTLSASQTVPRSTAQIFQVAEEVEAAKLALEVIAKAVCNPGLIPGPKALQNDEVQQKLVGDLKKKINEGLVPLIPNMHEDILTKIVRKTTCVYVEHIIAIPRIVVVPRGNMRAGFHDFSLELSSFRLQPVSDEILIQHLNSNARETIGAFSENVHEERFEDYVVRGLIDFDDINYDDQADLLYKLASQVVSHLKAYLKDAIQVRNVLLFYQRKIAAMVHAQMQPHAWEEASSYDVKVSHGFSEVRSQAFSAFSDEPPRPFDRPIDNKADIRKMIFGGFTKCLYSQQKFDSDSERRFAVVLENDSTVLKWFKPGRGVFQIRYSQDSDYEPDFVIETEAEKLICETKRSDQMSDATVLAKAKAAVIWCKHATAYEAANGGKPWVYALIPHDVIADNMKLNGLVKQYVWME